MPGKSKKPSQQNKIAGKKIKIFAEGIELEALNQFYSAMENGFAITGALLPDAHTGYTLPIGGVVGTDNYILPSWVGYDIGCGMCATATGIAAEHLIPFTEIIYKKIYAQVPTGFNSNVHPAKWDYRHLEKTKVLHGIFSKKGLKQLGTLGSGNHFIELGFDEDQRVWIIVHSGSRGLGHDVASHYMRLASGDGKAREGHFGFEVNSTNGQAYLKDMNFCVAYALENRKRIIGKIFDILSETLPNQPFARMDTTRLINRNHNHAEFKHGLWIHRKGATQAENGMSGVIPGNMRDGSFIVEGLGNPDSLWSSSHGAGRILGRRKAKQQLSLDQFRETMVGIKAKVVSGTLDESPFAYKDIFQIMDSQEKMVKILHHVKPIINIKA
ncbi:MAG: RtcB family protein [Deltaproteobacteria bacterium]|jgi:tRNA-splicing ligase RtcB (3'-phosphate/5'-hydroxy nucleic acid ligase)|nr:RtcB family protein [Deltaproteobacteria bacterium]MBT4263513.1 RtcB family protein [Deltaproteobacteria bacterium]MBT4642396.1 RtcB family protein [Deltaproteobacteria bacterium]MBT6502241.1 RtcB family protein [Deltaproteobacteria bacterium]MBT7151648.1 RtcB family protein [Deltaproteobacteria bacterium]